MKCQTWKGLVDMESVPLVSVMGKRRPKERT